MIEVAKQSYRELLTLKIEIVFRVSLAKDLCPEAFHRLADVVSARRR